jgi:hypothetical protein
MKDEQSLSLVVTCIDGSKTAFEQPDYEAAVKLVGQLDPGRVFSNPFINVDDRRSLTVFPSGAIVRIDLVSDLVVDWDFHLGIHDAYEITIDDFERLADRDRAKQVQSETHVTILAAIEMANADPVFFALVLNEQQEQMIQADFGMLLQRFLSASSFHGRKLGGGRIIVNSRHIVRLQFHPCPPEPQKSAWNVEPINRMSG